MNQAITLGITRHTLYTLRDRGIIDRIGEGIYHLHDNKPIGNPDFVSIAIRYPKAIICLTSALAYHEMTTQIPKAIDIAITRKSYQPSIKSMPIKVHRFSEPTFLSGMREYLIDNVPIRIYCPEKTLVDCFKFRHHLGIDIPIEALKLYKERANQNIPEILHYAKVCRVAKAMIPYLEATF